MHSTLSLNGEKVTILRFITKDCSFIGFLPTGATMWCFVYSENVTMIIIVLFISNKSYYIDHNMQNWYRSSHNVQGWRLRPKFSNSTNFYSVEVRSVNGTWYKLCTPNDGFHGDSPSLICQTVTNMMMDNTSSTHVAVRLFGQPYGPNRELPFASLPGNCSMYEMTQLQHYCNKGKMALPCTIS